MVSRDVNMISFTVILEQIVTLEAIQADIMSQSVTVTVRKMEKENRFINTEMVIYEVTILGNYPAFAKLKFKATWQQITPHIV